MLKWSCRFVFDCLKDLSTKHSLRWNHYKSLGLTPSASLAEVKAAYYKLSKLYHPDRNNGSEASAKKFRDIVAAYEVLSKTDLRRQYDKELSNYDYKKANFESKKKANKRIKKNSAKPKPHYRSEINPRAKQRSTTVRGKSVRKFEQEDLENLIVRAIPFVIACLMSCKKR